MYKKCENLALCAKCGIMKNKLKKFVMKSASQKTSADNKKRRSKGIRQNRQIIKDKAEKRKRKHTFGKTSTKSPEKILGALILRGDCGFL